MNTKTSIDADFKRRIEGALKTVQAWEDPQLLVDCRVTVPWEDLKKDDGPFSDDNDSFKHSSYAIIFFQRMCRYFKSTMTWINQPMCLQCQTTDHVQFLRTRGPETQPEIQGKASRVEVNQCTACNIKSDITFPRYNCPRTLLQTRQGRCGEYANLFGLYCRAVGYHTRYILDMTDHVWIEVCIPSNHRDQSDYYYCMGDGCEAVVNEPSMYEAGWGKQLSYILAITPSYVVDVTPRYTRQFASHEFLARRRAITSSEEAGQAVIQQINVTLLSKLSSVKQKQSIQKQWKEEEELLSSYKRLTEWARESNSYHQGRISGATEWKVARGEAGVSSDAQEKSENGDNQQPQYSTEYFIQTFLPSLHLTQAYIAIHPRPPLAQRTQAIIVSGAACAMGIPNQLSAVVVDPQTGTILQSKSFVSLQHLETYVDNLPERLILVVHGQLLKENGGDTTNPMNMHLRLALWKSDHVWDGGIIYVGVVGQVSTNASPWTVCAKIRDTVDPIVLQSKSTATVPDLKLRVHRSTRPNAVTGRLPDSYLPLVKQTTSTFAQKQAAFESFVSSSSSSSMSPIPGQCTSIVGFCTKPGSPIYLIGSFSYPLQPTLDEWATFVLLPAWLVPPNDCNNGAAVLDPVPVSASLAYEVPLDANVFVERLGPQLLVDTNQSIPTHVALQRKNPRLIAFYFSAHWCGRKSSNECRCCFVPAPHILILFRKACRSFTPMLTEFYNVLHEAFPSHGLEIVFVSSDRDASIFQHYYATMPWAAIPFEPALQHLKSKLSFQFGVQGIPSLVILDAISGAIVVDARISRGEIQQCCRRGDDSIVEQFCEWLNRIPSESREILSLLQASCHDTQVAPTDKDGCHDNAVLNKYVFHDDNMDLLENCLSRRGGPFTVEDWESQWRASAKDDWRIVVKTALQYVANARREPWNPKFRTFHWSNAVADRINSVMHGLEWWCQEGLELYTSQDDYVAWIPVHVDLDVLHARWSALLEDGTQ
jgi:peptide-N4-(N-acetyl-beta-glucosaminyl)asparagine amidase